MDATENLRGYAGDPNHNMHPDPYNNSIITPGSYTFLTGALEAPLKEQGGSLLQAPPIPHEDAGEPQSSSGSLIGTLFTNHLTAGSFGTRSPPVPSSTNSWELTINGGPAGSLYAGGSNIPNILINGSGMMAAANNNSSHTQTAQLLIGGLHGGSFNENDHGSVYYTPSQSHHQHAEAMQLIYVNAAGGYPGHSYHSADGRGSSSVATLLYPSQADGAAENNNSNNNSTPQSAYAASFLTQGAMSQRAALEAAGAIPLMSLAQEHNSRGHVSGGSSQSYNWPRSGGNEHSFLPVNSNEEEQNHQSLFGAALGRHGEQGHDLSHMHGTDHLQNDVGMHMDRSQGSKISVNGQGLLSLSLSSHQPHFHSPAGGAQLPESASDAHLTVVAQAAALAKTKELASRYLASSGANADLSRFRTPSRDDVMGSRFSHENVNSSSQSARKAHHLASASQSGAAGSSSNALSASAFLQSVQCILNELCKVTPINRNPKPASSTEQQYPLRSSSASVNANYTTYHGKEDSHSAMHGEVSTGRGDPPSSLSDVSQLVTVSHLPMQPEMMQGLADAARSSGSSRDDLEFKKGQLIRMLDEVEARFRRYSEQLQVTCAGFNAQAGPSAATPYTILALQAMSRHFRCLKDAVKNQLKVVRRALGEEDVPAGINGETSRLRYVDQQIRQQRALQQLGMLQQHAWRPQRGLPERAVSVLRAWLFEHFLHPYPKDVDKMSLAKQTGLTRSQVSNWFINARVRLWKPMVEEMYVEEQREAAELTMQNERIAREQASMHSNGPFDQQYDHGSRGRNIKAHHLQDELNGNGGQPASMPNHDFSSTDQGRDQETGGSNVHITEAQSQALYHTGRQQQDVATVGDHQNNFNNYVDGREAKRSKTALESVSDAFNNNNNSTAPMLIINPGNEGDNSTTVNQAPNSASPGGDIESMEARKLKGKSVLSTEHEHEHINAPGAFISYNDANSNITNTNNNVLRYDHTTAAGGYVASSTRTAAPNGSITTTQGVSLTLGLRHCDANNIMRPTSAMSAVAPMLEKYDMDVDIARMDPLDREEYMNHEAGRIRDHVNNHHVDNHGQFADQMQQQREVQAPGNKIHHAAAAAAAGNGLTSPEVLQPTGGNGLASPAEFGQHHHHHEFNDHGH